MLCEEKWNNDKEEILQSNKEELENMKKIRNMEGYFSFTLFILTSI